MSTVAEIEAAIRALPPAERERLADQLPSILPELNGDAKWQCLLNDERPRPALTALGDEIAARFKNHPEVSPGITAPSRNGWKVMSGSGSGLAVTRNLTASSPRETSPIFSVVAEVLFIAAIQKPLGLV